MGLVAGLVGARRTSLQILANASIFVHTERGRLYFKRAKVRVSELVWPPYGSHRDTYFIILRRMTASWMECRGVDAPDSIVAAECAVRASANDAASAQLASCSPTSAGT